MSTSTVQTYSVIAAMNALSIDARQAIEGHEADPIVYLLEQAGAELGYRFEWERYGPFSETLAADLSELTTEDLAQQELPEELRDPVAHLRQIVYPVPAALSPFTWTRLLAAVHFLLYQAEVSLHNGDRPGLLLAYPYDDSLVIQASERLRGFVSHPSAPTTDG